MPKTDLEDKRGLGCVVCLEACEAALYSSAARLARCRRPHAADQQKIADAFLALGLIPKAIKITDAIPANLVSAN
ncbi:hypothetical protein RPMA_03815 [Tardiphaga alba]|uniref:Uncharacterized protein n=1 Tax=Tardiphaga alba TaxID=340268 RepID=A0ABX8A483_9BRAD|nr:hypothetical protein RPMA_03815 [Tardiphaga alba]